MVGIIIGYYSARRYYNPCGMLNRVTCRWATICSRPSGATPAAAGGGHVLAHYMGILAEIGHRVKHAAENAAASTASYIIW